MTTRAVETWTLEPLVKFVKEAARGSCWS